VCCHCGETATVFRKTKLGTGAHGRPYYLLPAGQVVVRLPFCQSHKYQHGRQFNWIVATWGGLAFSMLGLYGLCAGAYREPGFALAEAFFYPDAFSRMLGWIVAAVLLILGGVLALVRLALSSVHCHGFDSDTITLAGVSTAFAKAVEAKHRAEEAWLRNLPEAEHWKPPPPVVSTDAGNEVWWEENSHSPDGIQE
jgi:hypothetical protein